MKDYKILFGYAALIFSIGFLIRSIAPSHAFPSGPQISMGTNPIMSFGGDISGSTSTLLTTSGQPFIVTDIVLTTAGSGNCTSKISLVDASNTVLAKYSLRNFFDSGSVVDSVITPQIVQHGYTSGIFIESNNSLGIVENGNCDTQYSLSGYFAHP